MPRLPEPIILTYCRTIKEYRKKFKRKNFPDLPERIKKGEKVPKYRVLREAEVDEDE